MSAAPLETIVLLGKLFDGAVKFSVVVKQRKKLLIRCEKSGAEFDGTRTGAVNDVNFYAAHLFDPTRKFFGISDRCR